MKRTTKSLFGFTLALLTASVVSLPVQAQGLLGFYQNNGIGSSVSNFQPYNSVNTGITGSNLNYQPYVNQAAQNFNQTGFGQPTVGGGGLTGFYQNNGIGGRNVNPYSQNTGGITSFYGQQMQANSFTRTCPAIERPNPTTCQGGQFRGITDNYGCTVSWRCEGGNFCPEVERPPASQCNGVWEPQYSTNSQCLTHYFCDRTPDRPTNCPAYYDPVCGELHGREMTYSNRCNLDAAGARFLYEGQCRTTPTPQPVAPVINRFNGPNQLSVGQTGTWTVSARGQNNDQLSYAIDWGDTHDYGARQASMRRQPSQQTTFTHQYSRPGAYTVRITVTNQRGQSATATATVRVEDQSNLKPSINSFTGPNTLEVGQTGTWRVSATHPAGSPVEFSINWGAPQPVYNQNRQIGPSYEQTFHNAYNRPGTYKVTVTARSGSASVTRTLTVRVTDRYPVGDLAPVVRGISGPTTLNVNQTGTWRVQASDPQNQDLQYQINWGDRGQYGAQARYSNVAGFVQNSAFTHQYSEPGTYTVSVTVRNATGKTARTTTTVRVNQAPIYEPYQPNVPNTPNVPYQPNVPNTPNEPYQPNVPNTPNVPYQPNVPNTPNAPYQPYTPPSYQKGYQFDTVPQFDFNSQYYNGGGRHSYFSRSYNWRR